MDDMSEKQPNNHEISDEKWNDWITPDGRDEWEKIREGPLSSVVRSLAMKNDLFLTPDKLARDYEYLDNQAREGAMDWEEAAPYLARITDKVIQLKEEEDAQQSMRDSNTKDNKEGNIFEQPEEMTIPENPDEWNFGHSEAVYTPLQAKYERDSSSLSQDEEFKREIAEQKISGFIKDAEQSGELDDVEGRIASVQQKIQDFAEAPVFTVADRISADAWYENTMKDAEEYSNPGLVSEDRKGVGKYIYVNSIRMFRDDVNALKPRDKYQEEQERLAKDQLGEARKATKEAEEARKAAQTQAKEAKRAADAAVRRAEEARKAREAQEKGADAQADYYELLRRDMKGLIIGETNRAYVNPERFDQELPYWYQELGGEEQNMIRTRLWLNYLAALKQDRGMAKFEAVATDVDGARVRTKDIENMFKKMPGFRIAMATFVEELFEKGEDHFVFSEAGIEKFKTDDKREAYRQEKIEAITRLLAHREDEFKTRYGSKTVTSKDIATAAVSAVDNLFFATGVYDSADEDRDLAPGQSSVYSEQYRAFYMPGEKVKDRLHTVRGKVRGKTERVFGGDLGVWLFENAASGLGDFDQKLENEELGYMPYRLFYSILDHAMMVEDDTGNRKYNFLGEALVSEQRVGGLNDASGELVDGLYDYQGGIDAIDWGSVQATELYGYYGDKKEKAIQLYAHLKGGSKKDRFSKVEEIIDALSKLRGDERIHEQLFNEDMLTAIMGLYISPDKGFVSGTTRNLLDMHEATYENKVIMALEYSDRLYEGMPSLRKNLYSRFMVSQPSRPGVMGDVFEFIKELNPIDSETVLVGARRRVRRQAENEMLGRTRNR